MRRLLNATLCMVLALMLLVSSVPAFAQGSTATSKASRKPSINFSDLPEIEATSAGMYYVWAAGTYDTWGYAGKLCVEIYKGSTRVFRYTEPIENGEDEFGEWAIDIPIENKKGGSILKPKTKYKVTFYVITKKGTSKKRSWSFNTGKKWW